MANDGLNLKAEFRKCLEQNRKYETLSLEYVLNFHNYNIPDDTHKFKLYEIQDDNNFNTLLYDFSIIYIIIKSYPTK